MMLQTKGVALQMPGRSHAGPLPPATDAERQLAERLRGHVTKLAVDIGPRELRNDYDALNRTADYLTSQLRDLGYEVGVQEYAVAGKVVRNLDTEVRGATLPEEVIVVGAHYDSVPGCPAANDNGSGVAAVLEMARLMRDERPARTVRFALFVNEEPPYFQSDQMGSRAYARRCRERGEKVVAMLSLETIGFYSDARGSQQYPPPFDRFFPSEGNFIAFVANTASADLVTRVVGSFRAHTPFPSEGIAAPEQIEGIGFSDQWSFWQEGYPAVMVTDTAMFRYPHYHRADDTPDKLDYDRTSRVVAGVTRVVRELAGGN
jgi:Zn-dependent M28 family amino/carboxypeptidase